MPFFFNLCICSTLRPLVSWSLPRHSELLADPASDMPSPCVRSTCSDIWSTEVRFTIRGSRGGGLGGRAELLLLLVVVVEAKDADDVLAVDALVGCWAREVVLGLLVALFRG